MLPTSLVRRSLIQCATFATWLAAVAFLPMPITLAKEVWLVGLGKVDITPEEPVRLSGYSNRDKPHTDVADKLHARAMAITRSADGALNEQQVVKSTGDRTVLLISIDSIAIVGVMTRQIEEILQREYGLARSDFVLCSTHSHAAPQAAHGLTNIYRTPLNDEEQAAIERYAARVKAGILQAVADAMRSRQVAQLEVGVTKADFAMNRRVLKNGLWTGFGRQADGPVDHRVQLLRATTPEGKLLGAAFMYACHCTTLGGDFNKVSADWAGLAATELESKHDSAVFLPVIGCGADANPEPRTGYDDALKHGAEMAGSIEAVIGAKVGQPANESSPGRWESLTSFPETHFGYAGLASERPSKADLQVAITDKDVTRQRWAQNMLQVLAQKGRLPETYPAPIHTWSFGKQLLWVFMGGEVVVDYQMRLEKNLDAERVWVAAYTDDVFAYVASERMRAEGGYEVDFSMLFYNQPGRWQSGTEDLIERRVREILTEEQPDDRPRTPSEAVAAIHVPDGFQVDLMAAEPLVNDPVNIAFGHDGSVWVAEMSDYPLGVEGGGRIRRLHDSDGNGTLDQSQVFLEKLSFPSSVTPWRDGAIVVTSPAIFFAADRDGDGRAEVREELLQGIAEANPQHRASGFEMGLDGWLNFTSGDGTRELVSTRNGQRSDVSRRDVRWQPDTGEFTLTSGHTQFVRARDEFNNWFGNVNNQPMFHYVIEDNYRRRTGLSGPPLQHLLNPPIAPPVFPASRTKDRFNDLNTFNRFTSACSSIICRVPGLGPEMRGAALVCEPVHNLVARFKVQSDGASFTARRLEQDNAVDFFASSDPLCRPVRIVNAPDGSLWIVDMVRLVIEHPEWIPTAWQGRLDLRAGSGLGRIYRVHHKDFTPSALPRIDKMSLAELLQTLASDNGALRDLAAQQLLWRMTDGGTEATPSSLEKTRLLALTDAQKDEAVTQLREMVSKQELAEVRAQALGLLEGLKKLDDQSLKTALLDRDQRVRRYAVTLAETAMAKATSDLASLLSSVEQEQDIGVLLQWSLSLGGAENAAASEALESIATKASKDVWLAKSLAMVDEQFVDSTLAGLLQSIRADNEKAIQPDARGAVEQSLRALWGRGSVAMRQRMLKKAFGETATETGSGLSDLQILLLSAIAAGDAPQLANDPKLTSQVRAAVSAARVQLRTGEASNAMRLRLVPLLVIMPENPGEVLGEISRLIGPQEPTEIQQAALNVARKLALDATPQALLGKWSELLPDVRSSVCALLLERSAWGEQLVAALESGAVKVNDLDVSVVERLRSYGDEKLQARIQRVLGKIHNSDRAKLVQEWLAKLPASGDSARGEKHFVDHCAVCHRTAPGKAIVGAPLENISNWNREQWVVAILDPSRSIEPKYHQYTIVTQDGRTLAGVIEDRSAHQLTLAAADGKRHEIELSQIEQLKDQGVSLMPEGLETKLDPQGLADMLQYLQSLSVRK